MRTAACIIIIGSVRTHCTLLTPNIVHCLIYVHVFAAIHCAFTRVIDYFSFDVEGAEWKIMENFPWEAYTFLTITVERPTAPLVHKLQKNGYTFVRYFGGPQVDHMYIHKSLPNFNAVMKRYKGLR